MLIALMLLLAVLRLWTEIILATDYVLPAKLAINLVVTAGITAFFGWIFHFDRRFIFASCALISFYVAFSHFLRKLQRKSPYWALLYFFTVLGLFMAALLFAIGRGY